VRLLLEPVYEAECRSGKIRVASGITPEGVVRNYLALMAAGKFTEVLDELIENESVGIDPAHKSSGMPLEEAETKGLVGKADKESVRSYALEVLARQRDYVIEEFGENAWQETSAYLSERTGTWKLSVFQWEPKFTEPEGDI
jgi:hypothetical protein